jgi:hypothetical protein
MQLIEVVTRNTAREFLKVPGIIYREDKNWISPLDKDVEATFDPGKNPLFKTGEVTRWVLRDGSGSLIGRVAAFVNQQLAHTFRQPTGGIGFFECINDREAAFLLFDRCREWLQERGMEAMDGPINFGEKERFWGLLVDGFDRRPTYLLNYNPPYYRELFEAYGFRTFYEQFVYHMDANVKLPPILEEKFKRLMKAQGFRFEHLNIKQLEKYAEDFLTVYNKSWTGTHKFFRPMTKPEALQTFSKMKGIIDEELVVFGYRGEEPIAFLVCIPELNQLFRYVNGKLNLWGKLKFLFYRRMGKARSIQGLVFGTVPEYRNKGVESGLILTLRDLVVPKKWYRDMYMNWIGDFNPKMSKIVEHIGAKKAFTLITYRKLFDDTAEFERHPVLD